MNVEKCARCGSKIVEDRLRAEDRALYLTRQADSGGYESDDAKLCSMCWDDLWEWTFGDDAPDRSHLADPQPLDEMADSVERHIDHLQDVIDAVEAAKDGGG